MGTWTILWRLCLLTLILVFRSLQHEARSTQRQHQVLALGNVGQRLTRIPGALVPTHLPAIRCEHERQFVLCPQYIPAHIIFFIWTLHPGFFLEWSPFLVGFFIGPVVFTALPSAFKNSCKLRWWKREEEKNQTREQNFLTSVLSSLPSFSRA